MHKWILVGILTLGFFLRIISLTNHPSGFTPDEASFGYDAYSILKTGKDQWGNTLPLVFKSFGDGKLPIYTYITIPSVAIFGLNEFAVRLPNVIFGTLAILATYLLTKELFKNKFGTSILGFRIWDIAAFMLAISPWHLPLSRGAFEANLTTFFLPLGIYLFLLGLKNKKYMWLSMLIFGINVFTYHSARFVTPLVVLSLVLIYSNPKKFLTKYKTSSTIFIILSLLTLYTFMGGGGTRISSSSIFSLAENVKDDRFAAVLSGTPDLVARVFNNKVSYTADTFISNYLSYFSPQFLFTQGPNEATYGMVPGAGVLYFIEIVFLIGFLFSYKKPLNTSYKILTTWLLVASIPAALSIGPGHAANRAAIMMPALQIISATGALYFFKFLKKFKSNMQHTIYFILFAVLATQFAFYLEDYFVQQKAKHADSMIYGTRKVFQYLNSVENNYQNIIISKKISEPHIFAAFYNKIHPTLFQTQSQNWNFEDIGLAWVDQLPEYSLNNYTFTSIDWVKHSRLSNTLIIGAPSEFPENISPQKIIYYPNKSVAYYIVDIQTKDFAWQKSTSQ